MSNKVLERSRGIDGLRSCRTVLTLSMMDGRPFFFSVIRASPCREFVFQSSIKLSGGRRDLDDETGISCCRRSYMVKTSIQKRYNSCQILQGLTRPSRRISSFALPMMADLYSKREFRHAPDIFYRAPLAALPTPTLGSYPAIRELRVCGDPAYLTIHHLNHRYRSWLRWPQVASIQPGSMLI